MADYFEKKQQEISVQLIASWKANESKLMAEYGSRSNYFLQEMAARLWEDAEIRAEFANFEILQEFLKNEHRTAMHQGGLSRHEKPTGTDSDEIKADPAKTSWDADAALRAEFDNNFDSYKEWQRNKHRVRNFA